jgi:regulator of sirC expression with transglutaminase-like and TPR domain
MKTDLMAALTDAASTPDADLAHPSLLIARLERPGLDPEPYIAQLDEMGAAARQAIERSGSPTSGHSAERCIAALNAYLFDTLGFQGNGDKYGDPRFSCLNEVLERRTGIPLTLSIVYLEVARRAGLRLDGVNFPGHFLVRCPEMASRHHLVIDPFHRGALLSEQQCRVLLRQHVGDEVRFSRSLLEPATRLQILLRMLSNLKRIYVNMRSFPQARNVTDLLLALNPSALHELRDRGLLSYHLNDLSAALRDLQAYLKLSGLSETDKEERADLEKVWEHVKTLRRRVAALN